MNTLTDTKPRMILGDAASAGIARGPAVICRCTDVPPVPRRSIEADDVKAELDRFESAAAAADAQLCRLASEQSAGIGTCGADILAVQLDILHDPLLRDDVAERCRSLRINVEAAVSDATDRIAAAFGRLGDPLLRDRAIDVRDVARRLVDNLLHRDGVAVSDLEPGSIVVARELLPTLAAGLARIGGLVAEGGGATSHAVILARSLGIPVVIRAEGALREIRDGDPLIVDGLAGRVFVSPSEEVRREYDSIQAKLDCRREALREFIDLPAVTRDGVAIMLSANAGKVADAAAAAACHANGIGLYRTEFAFLVHSRFPTEEQQYRLYRSAADQVHPRTMAIRMLDVGSDKVLPYFPLPPEPNPSLGSRGTRLLLAHPEILRTQLRAVLRLSATHPVALLFPMIGGVEEFIAARDAVAAAQAELRREKQPFNPNIPLGAMIETAGAALTARDIARLADFVSIGSNDLVQYLLTADRTSSAVAAYYEPMHPAVIRALKHIVDAARSEGKPLSLCGEMAGNPACTALLLGLGVTTLSVAPSDIPELRRTIRSVDLGSARRMAEQALTAGSIAEVKACIAGNRLDSEAAFDRRAIQRWRWEGGAGD